MAPNVEAVVSMTDPGEAPPSVRATAGVVQVPRRSMEARVSESIAPAAVTPQAFTENVRQAMSGYRPAGQPRSFGPQPIIEECQDV